jgi:UDP-N-acetylmuramoylalanine--D-glutamate ligase
MIRVEQLRDRDVLVFGLARTGIAAARALAAGGARPVVWDDGPKARADGEAQGLALADPATVDWSRLAALVLSPGVPLTHPEPHLVVRMARAAGVPVIGDVELFAATPARGPAPIVAITGTNGKSTTTALIGHLVASAERDAQVGGNLGRAVLDLDPAAADGAYVLELSSFQIDLLATLAPDVAILLNITPDHLDRHGDMAGYAAVKERLFRDQRAGQTAIVGVDDEFCRAIADRLDNGPARVLRISVEGPVARGAYVIDGILWDAIDGAAERVADLGTLPRLPGRHNWQNAAAAYLAARALGIPRPSILDGLASFPGLAHRMELVAEIDGVRFVNDSKATNADAAAKALAAYPAIWWIAGGKAKAGGIESLDAFFPRIRRAYLIGDAAGAFARTLDGKVPHEIAGDLARAVGAAFGDARSARDEHPVVLLSPACASFDQFKDYEQRGEVFRGLVEALRERAA